MNFPTSARTFQLRRNFPTSAKLSNFTWSFATSFKFRLALSNFSETFQLQTFQLKAFQFLVLSNYTYPKKQTSEKSYLWRWRTQFLDFVSEICQYGLKIHFYQHPADIFEIQKCFSKIKINYLVLWQKKSLQTATVKLIFNLSTWQDDKKRRYSETNKTNRRRQIWIHHWLSVVPSAESKVKSMDI